MSVTLSPITAEKLEQFRRRRRVMVWLRGLSGAVVGFLAMMMLVSIADWLWVMSAATRYTLSAAAYLVTAVIVYFTCLRPLRADADARTLAGRLETAEPELHEQVLAAIELSDSAGTTPSGSAGFRQLVQEAVAGRLSGLQIAGLLPLRLILRWLLAAGVVVAIVAALSMMPGIRFRQLLTRAMLPMANIDRVSRTRVEILEPTPASLQVPENETVGVVVAISGARAEQVTVEVFPEQGDPYLQPMRLRGAKGEDARRDQFATNLSVKNQDLQYRVLAGDAVTRLYSIRTSPRPLAMEFKKTYRYPEYTQLPTKSLRETTGDLTALAGTEATLEVRANQPLELAELVFDVRGQEEPRRLPMRLVDAEPAGVIFMAELPIEEDSLFQVRMVAKSTGFDDPFSPQYELRPQPDLVPRVRFVDPPTGVLLLPPNDLLDLTVGVEDELPLKSVGVEVSVNQQGWQPRELEVPDSSEATLPYRWDLKDWDLQAGDRVQIRTVAIDRKGQRGESAPLLVTIAADDFDPERHESLQRRMALLEDVWKWSRSVTALEDALEDEFKAAAGGQAALPAPEDLPQDKLDLAVERSAGLIDAIRRRLPEMRSGYEAEPLELLARAVDATRYELLDWRQACAEVSDDSEEMKSQAEQLRRRLAAAGHLAQAASEGYAAQMSHDFEAAVIADLARLQRHLDRLLEPTVKPTPARMQRHHLLTRNELRALQQMVAAAMPQLVESSQESLRPLESWLLDWSEGEPADRSLQGDEVRRQTQRLAREIDDRLRNTTLDSRLPSTILDRYSDVDRRVGSIATSMQRTRSLTDAAIRAERDASGQLDSEARRDANRLWEATLARIAGRTPLVQQRLSTWRQVHQLRPDSDQAYPADATLAMRAWAAVVEAEGQPIGTAANPAPLAPVDRITRQLNEIAAAYQILEAGHEVMQFRREVTALLQAERWRGLEIDARTLHPLASERLGKSNALAIQRIKDARLPEEVRRPLEAMRWSEPTRELNQRMGIRRWDREQWVSQVTPLSAKEREIDAVIVALQPRLEAARERLRRFVPSEAELARAAAEQLRALQQETAETAEKIAETASPENEPAADEPAAEDAAPEAPQRAAQVKPLDARQQDAQRQIQELLDAMVDDANQQDLLTEEGRARARDTDDALAMLQEPREAMQEAMQRAATADDAAMAAAQLEEAAKQQGDAAEALEKVAQHLEAQATNQDADATRQALRAAEPELGIERQLDQQYAQAEQMAMAAQRSPEELLKRLERELARNEAMREALSEISAETVEQARRTLTAAAQQEQEIQQQIERADPAFQARKERLTKQLGQLARELANVNDRLVRPTRSIANRDPTDAADEPLAAAEQALREAQQATQQVDANSLLKDVAAAAAKANEQLKIANQQLQQAEKKGRAAAGDAVFDEARQRNEMVKRVASEQARAKSSLESAAQSLKRDAQRQQEQAKKQLQRAQRDAEAAERGLKKAERDHQKKPDEAWTQNHLQRAQQQVEDQKQRVAEARRDAEAAEAGRHRAERQEQAIKQWQPERPDAENPAAAATAELASRAREMAASMQQQAEAAAKAAGFEQTLQAQGSQLAEAAPQQQRVGRDVEATSAALQRAARHEARLQQRSAAQALARQAAAVAKTRQDTVQSAVDSLERVAADAAAQEAAAQEAAAQEAALAKAGGPEPSDQAATADSYSGESNSGESNSGERNAESGGAIAGTDEVPSAEALREQLQGTRQALGSAEQELAARAADLGEQLAASERAAANARQTAANKLAASAESTGASAEATPSTAAAAGTPGSPPASSSQAPGAPASAAAAAERAGERPSEGTPSASPASGAAQPSARAQMLARALDEIDRAVYQPNASSAGEASAPTGEAASPAGEAAAAQAGEPAAGASSESRGESASTQAAPAAPANSPLGFSPTLAATAAQRAQTMAIERSQTAQAMAAQASASESSAVSAGSQSGAGDAPAVPEAFEVNRVDRDQASDWGQLTKKSAKDLNESARDPVAERYRRQVEAYFRTIAEQAGD